MVNKNELYMFFEDFTSSHIASMAPENMVAIVDPSKPEDEENDNA